ncbi:hypothetical protein Droror1_Dr00008353 [Drosera rotundifolia]
MMPATTSEASSSSSSTAVDAQVLVLQKEKEALQKELPYSRRRIYHHQQPLWIPFTKMLKTPTKISMTYSKMMIKARFSFARWCGLAAAGGLLAVQVEAERGSSATAGLAAAAGRVGWEEGTRKERMGGEMASGGGFDGGWGCGGGEWWCAIERIGGGGEEEQGGGRSG